MYKKLLEIQSELKAPKDLVNSFGGYKYRSCESILEALKPLLVKHGVTLLMHDEMVLVGSRVYVQATATLREHGKEPITITAFAREEETKKGMDASQITGAASSYARKYALNGLFLIDDNKDSDTTNTGGQSEVKAPQRKEPEAKSEEVVKVVSGVVTAHYPPKGKGPHSFKVGDSGYLKTFDAIIAETLIDHKTKGDVVFVDYKSVEDGKYTNNMITGVSVQQEK